MTVQEFEALGKKVTEGSATAEERLTFLRELNSSIERLVQALAGKERLSA
jgi:hypothetical protein